MRNTSTPSQTTNPNAAVDEITDSNVAAHNVSAAPHNTNDSSHIEPVESQRDLILTHREALAGSPEDIAVCGEEDIGSGLEFLVTRNRHSK